MSFHVNNPHFEKRIRSLFASQTIMTTMDMQLTTIEPGHIEIEMAFNSTLIQHHGYHHAGVATIGMDNACGYAACSLMKADQEVLTVEFKSNFLRPAIAERFRFTGDVTKPGENLYFCEGAAFGMVGGESKLIATMSATMMAVTVN